MERMVSLITSTRYSPFQCVTAAARWIRWDETARNQPCWIRSPDFIDRPASQSRRTTSVISDSIRRMSNTVPPPGFPPGPSPQMPWPPAQLPRGPARWPVVVMFAITLVAVGAAIAAWLRPIPYNTSATTPSPSYSEQQVADAKSKVCAAIEKVKKANTMNSNRNGGDDPNGQLLTAVNGRQVYIASSQYVLTTLADEPATPAELVAAGRRLANLYQVIAMDGLASDPSQAARDAASATGTPIDGFCK